MRARAQAFAAWHGCRAAPGAPARAASHAPARPAAPPPLPARNPGAPARRASRDGCAATTRSACATHHKSSPCGAWEGSRCSPAAAGHQSLNHKATTRNRGPQNDSNMPCSNQHPHLVGLGGVQVLLCCGRVPVFEPRKGRALLGALLRRRRRAGGSGGGVRGGAGCRGGVGGRSDERGGARRGAGARGPRARAGARRGGARAAAGRGCGRDGRQQDAGRSAIGSRRAAHVRAWWRRLQQSLAHHTGRAPPQWTTPSQLRCRISV